MREFESGCVVVGEHRCVSVLAPTAAFEPLGEARVQVRAPRERQRGVRDLAREGVLEGVFALAW